MSATPKSVLRKQLLENGYVPIPVVNETKKPAIKRWSRKSPKIGLKDITTWEEKNLGSGTGIRTDGLVVVDIDVTDQNLGTEVLRLAAHFFEAPQMARAGEPPKVALVYRRDDDKPGKKLQTGAWKDDEGRVHRVELLSGRGAYLMAYGIHPKTGQPYLWSPEHPQLKPLAELQPVSEQAVLDFRDECRRLFKGRGLEYVTNPHASLGDEFAKKESLRADQVIKVVAPDDWAGEFTVDALEDALKNADVDAEFTVRVDTGSSQSHPDSGCAGLCKDGYLRVVDFVDNVCLLRPSEERRVNTQEELAKLLDKKETMWLDLCDNWVYVACEDKFFHKDHPHRGYSETAMTRRSRNWKYDGEPMIDAWLETKATIVEDQHFDPTTTDRIVTIEKMDYLNRCIRPAWEKVDPDDAQLQLWEDFIGHLLPRTEERETYLDWLANKIQRPWQRMFGVLMVAPRFGTGRGTLSQIIGRLLGQQNVTEVDFAKFMGKGSQGQFYDWLYESLVVSIPECFSENKRWDSRVAAYERIKLMVDPGQQRRDLALKYARNANAAIFASIMAATNHPDAFAVVEDDRRLLILENGPPMPETLRVALHGRQEGDRCVGGWLENDRAVAALWRLLSARKPTRDLFRAPMQTEAKARMIEAAKTDLDFAWDEFLRVTGAQAFTVDQFKRFCMLLSLASDTVLPENFDSVFQGGFLRTKGCTGDRVLHRTSVKGKRTRFLVTREFEGAPDEGKEQVKGVEKILDGGVEALKKRLVPA